MKLEQKVETTKQEETSIRDERVALEDKVSRLYKKSLDLDLLEERARHQLGVKASNEIVYFRDSGSDI